MQQSSNFSKNVDTFIDSLNHEIMLWLGFACVIFSFLPGLISILFLFISFNANNPTFPIMATIIFGLLSLCLNRFGIILYRASRFRI